MKWNAVQNWPGWGAVLRCGAGLLAILILSVGALRADEAVNTRTETFDRDPDWDGRNNRATTPEPMKIVHDFGYSPTGHAGGKAGEVGGFFTPSAEPACYGKVLRHYTFNDTLIASGKLRIPKGGGHFLLGFFNADTLNEWRTPNTVALRFGGEGDSFVAYLEYATSRWRAGGVLFTTLTPIPGDTRKLFQFPAGDATHSWSIKYDPKGNGGGGTLTATIDDQTVTAHLTDGHKADGAIFNRFGLLNMMRYGDARTGSIWIDDLSLNGENESFDRDPQWEGFHNRRTFVTTYVRPRFDFGHSLTHFAGGRTSGELGGLTFRGDERFPERMAYYGDRIESLTLDKPLKASGKVCLKQCVTDSMGLLGFFHSTDSMVTSNAQRSIAPENFLGIAVEGPSDEGFFVYPYYASRRPDHPPDVYSSQGAKAPRIFPDGKSHDWSLEYIPADADAKARLTVVLDGQPVSMILPAEEKTIGARFNRFGMITTHVDGNGLKVYFDDLTYTFRQ